MTVFSVIVNSWRETGHVALTPTSGALSKAIGALPSAFVSASFVLAFLAATITSPTTMANAGIRIRFTRSSFRVLIAIRDGPVVRIGWRRDRGASARLHFEILSGYAGIAMRRKRAAILDQHVAVLKALSDPTRLQLLKLLIQCATTTRPSTRRECAPERCKGNALCVNALTDRLGVTQSAVSQHLRVLRQAGLVWAERRGSFVHYRPDRTRIAASMNAILSDLLK
jgi:DNA-binding transcriptional ArsR family regulator